ncbi:MAG: flagellar assembly protein FliW [Oligoflexia bacterium]|nr:flagellar assembly protein FliW [Oligoflexia bacterium]
MNDEKPEQQAETFVLKSARFGDLSVPVSTVITFPSGMIGFPRAQRFVMLDYKPPFSWLHSVDDPNLAFVVVDGAEFTKHFDLKPPFGDRDSELKEEDEYAVLVVVTVRPDPKLTTANLKAPLFVNIRNRKGVQVIYDNPKLSTRYAIWGEPQESEKKDPEKK